MRGRAFAGALLAACLATACGGRVGQEQVLAESAADGYGAGGSAAATAGAGGAASTRPGSTATGAGGSATGPAAATGTNPGSGVASPAAGGDGGGTGAVDPATGAAPDTTLPPGGNGGATDIGITDTSIILGNVSTLSGPVPGLFRGALIGTQAWAAMINSQGGINGRMIEIRSGDDALDSGKNRAATLALKDDVFAFLGSFSVTDDGVGSALAGTNVPDIGYPLAASRFQLPNNYSAFPAQPGWESGPFHYYSTLFAPEVFQHTGFFVSAIESARAIAARERTVMEQNGYQVVYNREVQANEPNYTGDVVQMRRTGVRNFMWEGQADQIGNMVNTMAQQGFHPDLLNLGATTYSNAYLDLAGAASEGAYIDLTTAMYLGEDAASVPEVATFLQWMEAIDPDQDVDLFAVYAWASGRLLEEALRSVGPNVTRDAVLAAVGNIHQFDANGLIGTSDPGSRLATNCFLVARIQNGAFVREHPSSGFDCTSGPYVPIG